MHDIVIRGGTIIDGTGRAAFTGDVAIAGGRLAAVGGKAGPARREIDAAGLMITPGWVTRRQTSSTSSTARLAQLLLTTG
jgi:N-acyl-D-amino-acid deacylase